MDAREHETQYNDKYFLYFYLSMQTSIETNLNRIFIILHGKLIF